MGFHVPEIDRITFGNLKSSFEDGNNGAFTLKLDGLKIHCIASDGMEWEHISVSRKDQKMPSWNTMCKVKETFWDDEDCVIQFHPKKSENISLHDTCLHLWKPTGKEFPRPSGFMIGPKR